MLRLKSWLKACAAFGTLLAVARLAVALAFPTPTPLWLSKSTGGTTALVVGTNLEAQQYYAVIGAPATFRQWSADYSFVGGSEVRAVYYNAGDLGFGRDMHCRETAAYVACYVTNHGFGPASPPEQAVNDVLNGRNALPTVAMRYSKALDGQLNDVAFYIYDTDGNLLTGVPLDGQGVKYAPQLCIACHGGYYSAGAHTVSGANFLPFSLASFRYSGASGFSRASQEEKFRQLNAMVYHTNPLQQIKNFINLWYLDVNQPGSQQNDQYRPPAWDLNVTDRRLYDEVVKPYCRSCHMAQPDRPLDSPDDLLVGVGNDVYTEFIMPHAELSNHNFWHSRAPVILADELGWSYRVTRLDDPAPNGCNPGDCSLREAVLAANATSSAYLRVITFAVNGTFTLSRVGFDDNAQAGDLDITTPDGVVILGNGPNLTVIDGNGDVTNSRVFHLLSGAKAVIQGVTIQGGRVDGYGGGILNDGGTLDLNSSVVRDNTIVNLNNFGAGIANLHGATTTILQTTVGPANRALASSTYGGGLYNSGSTLKLEDGTLSSNRADHGAGAYNTGSGAVMTVMESTVSRNLAGSNGDGLYNAAGAKLVVGRSLVAGNYGGDCVLSASGTYQSLGHNLVGENGFANGCTASATDIVLTGTVDSALEPNLISNQAGQLYHPLRPNSPAIDAIPVSGGLLAPGCQLPAFDQRDVPRPFDGNADGTSACDIGAREFVRADVTTGTDQVADDGLCSLREAVEAANTGTASGLTAGECPAGPDLIELAAPGPFNLSSGQLTVYSQVILDGNGKTIARSGGTGRLFEVKAGAFLNLHNVTLRNGSRSGICFVPPCQNYSGGGIYINTNGAANILNSAIVSNTTTYWGGGISNYGWLNLANSTISGNSASGAGGGLYNAGTLLMTNDTVANNTADSDANGSGDGGGIAAFGGTTLVKGSLIALNSDSSAGASYPDVYRDASAVAFVSYDYNLVGNAAGSGAGTFTGAHDLAGTSGSPMDPKLAGLTGAPPFHPLEEGSPAVNRIPAADCTFLSGAGNALFTSGAPILTDQRGALRPVTAGGACDVGAYELTLLTYLPIITH